MKAFDRKKRMFIHGKAVIEITHHERIDQLEFRQQNRQQPKRMHGTQSISRERLHENWLQVQPPIWSRGWRCKHGWHYLLDSHHDVQGRFQSKMGYES